jgi:hypothetical protein
MYGHTRAWSERRAALSSPIAAALVPYSGSYRIVFLGSVVPYLAGLALMLSYPSDLDGTKPEKESVNFLKVSGKQIVATIKGFIDIFKHPGFLVALLAPLVGLMADTVGIAVALGSMGALLLIVFPFLRVRYAPRSERQN